MKFGLSILATEFGVQPFELAKQAESLGLNPSLSLSTPTCRFSISVRGRSTVALQKHVRPVCYPWRRRRCNQQDTGVSTYARIHRYPHEI